MTRSILGLGLPAGFQNAIFAIANLFIQAGVNSFDSLMVMQKKAGCAHLAQKDPLFGKYANGVQKVCSRFPT